MNRFSDNLKRIRKEKKITQKELASALGVSQSVIHFWETERNQPTFANLVNLSIALNCKITDLMPNNTQEKLELLNNAETEIKELIKIKTEKQKQKELLVDEIEILNNEQYALFELLNNHFGFEKIAPSLLLLNEKGIEKVIEYINDLAENPKYRNNPE